MLKRLLLISAFALSVIFNSCTKNQPAPSNPVNNGGSGPATGGGTTPGGGGNTTEILPAITWINNFAPGTFAGNYRTGKGMASDGAGNIYILKMFSNQVYADPKTKNVQLTTVNQYAFMLAKYGPSGSLIWARSIDGNFSEENNYTITVGGDGSIYIGGAFKGAMQYNSKVVLTSQGPSIYSGFIMKIANDGALTWAKTIVDSQRLILYDLAVDKSDNVFVIGRYYNIIYFNNSQLSFPLGTEQAFIARYDSKGNNIWGLPFFGSVTTFDNGNITIDPSGNLLIAMTITGGIYYQDIDKKTATLTNYTDPGTVIAKVTPAGKYSWVKTFDNVHLTSVGSMVTDAGGDLYLTGAFKSGSQGNVNFFSHSLWKLATDGSTTWVKNFAGNNIQNKGAVALNTKGEIFFTGAYYNTVNLGGTALKSTSDISAYLAKFQQDGTMKWVRDISADDANSIINGFDIVVNEAGEATIGGSFSGSINKLTKPTGTNAAKSGSYYFARFNAR